MIYLDFDEPNDEEWEKWITECNAEAKLLIRSHRDETPKKIKKKLYDKQKSRYDDYPFYGKCAYCESKVEENSPTYVEHFRPKGGVCDMDNKPIRITKNSIQTLHPGYYWLAYNWRNLLPTCWQCNTWHKDKSGEMVGKGNRFPLIGEYAETPGEEVNENPLLINPMFENPENQIYMDKLGIIHCLPNSRKGQVTESLFGLNTREALIHGRKKEYEDIRRKVKALFAADNNETKSTELEHLKLIAKGKDQFTLAARKAIADVVSDSQSDINLIRGIL